MIFWVRIQCPLSGEIEEKKAEPLAESKGRNPLTF